MLWLFLRKPHRIARKRRENERYRAHHNGQSGMTGATGQRPRLQSRLRVLATSDLHMHLTGFDYHADRPVPTVGLTHVASLISQARDEADAEACRD